MGVRSFGKDILSPEDATRSFERVEYVLQDRDIKPSDLVPSLSDADVCVADVRLC